MSEELLVHGFNENHQRRLRITFQYIDKLLSEAEHTMDEAGSASPFREHADDTTPIQRKVTHDYILRIRETMRRMLEEADIEIPQPRTGAVWSAGVSLMFCSIALEDLSPQRMAGYGGLTSEAAATIDGMRGELGSLLDKLAAYLAKGGSTDLQKRLEQLGKTKDEVRLLSEIERIITAHGLIEFRTALTTLLDRFENLALEIGVFGRVSSGKSSLLNHLLQTDVLPVGVTPVTAVPTRISHGEVAEANIEFAEALPRKIPFEELADYASEEKNPANRKHVTRIFVKLSSQRLSEGVTFVDTPGLGSLALAGAEETVAYLPRCDLGIVLVDASSGLTQEDLVVVQALYHAGATAMVLVSKADLFSSTDRERMVNYVKSNLQTQLHLDPPVYPISVIGKDANLCDRWFEDELRPMMARHRELILESQKRKVGGLRDAVIAALERRLRVNANDGQGIEQRTAGERPAASFQNAEQALERAQGQAYFLTNKIVQAKPDIIASAAEAIATDFAGSDNANPSQAFERTLTHILADHVAATLHFVEQTRETVLHTIRASGAESPAVLDDELPKPTGMPPLDASAIAGEVKVEKPSVLSLFGKTALAAYVRRKLEGEFDHHLFEFLSVYANRLRRWMEQSIKALREAYDARADMQRARATASEAAGPEQEQSLQDDLELLKTWEHQTGSA
jgi:GTP-binding protein EngB required for normal cell division